MRYFAVLDLQYVILMIFLGLAALTLICVAFSGDASRRKRGDEGEDLEAYAEGIQVGRGPIPPIMIFVYVGFVIWALGYVLVVGIIKGPF